MKNERRSFFKGIAAFATGAAAAMASKITLNKPEEPVVSNAFTITDKNGDDYEVLAVKKTGNREHNTVRKAQLK